MSKGIKKVLGALTGLTLLGLNIAVVLFFTRWQTADSAAINRMETATDVDPVPMTLKASAAPCPHADRSQSTRALRPLEPAGTSYPPWV